MDFLSRHKYEPIEPVPRRGQKKMTNYLLIGMVVVALGVLALVIILSMTRIPVPADEPSPAPGPVPSDTNNIVISSTAIPMVHDNATSITILSQGTGAGSGGGHILKAPAPPRVLLGAEAPNGGVLVTLDAGEIQGGNMKSRAGRNYLAFLGIPYAKPPLGDLRFKSPVEAEPWNGTLDATAFKPDCIQKDKYNRLFVTKGSEDCLYLNVFTPKNVSDLGRRRNRFPVMFYIHGGGQFGSGTRYGADYLMDEDVIFVTVHYRLGVLGNLNTNDSEARGNQGMKDQVMALQWVQDNIKRFGGDRGKVTIFGNSYGGMQVAAHLLSPMSKDLFNRAIVQSGTMLQVGLFPIQTRDVAYDLGEKLNCTSRVQVGNSNNSTTSTEVDDLDTTQLVSCFREIDVVTLVLQSFVMDFVLSVDAPSNSTNTEEADVFLPDEPLHILQSGDFNAADLMIGTVSGEGIFATLAILADKNTTKFFNENWTIAAVDALGLEYASNPSEIANAARDFYLGNASISRAVQPNFTDMFSDRNFVHASYVTASFQLATNRRRQHVYLYYFNKDANKTYAQPALNMYGPPDNETFLGAGHADELQFIFPYQDYPYIPEGSKEANFSKMMVRLWTTFASTGEPTGANNGAEWLAIEEPKPYRWFQIEEEPKMIDTLAARMNFWDKFNLTALYGRPPTSSSFEEQMKTVEKVIA